MVTVIYYGDIEYLQYQKKALESRFVSERDGGDHKRPSPSRLLTSVKIPV